MSSRTYELGSGAVLFVADLLQPVDVLAIQRFLNSDVGHCGLRRCAVPMLQSGREPNHIVRANFLNGTAFALNPSHPGRDDQGLPQGMRVPGRPRARLECDAPGGDPPWFSYWEERVDPHSSGEVVPRSLVGRLRTARVICMASSLPCVATFDSRAAAARVVISAAILPVAARIRLRVIMMPPRMPAASPSLP